ncbi:pentatricopeptide repeat-containing protein At4g35130, chloroplastic-like [Arachis ipaensis]|nr:pentatricopeptide repeat-containing protein At4g35130, chloroplastic-like [Arachis ipaensis]XP_025664334.1 pentatricopeptide repeat-containing protein At4g35130, chloroplastic-like [Arachis hypogaea]
MSHSNTFHWNLMIRGYTDNDFFLHALNLYITMRFQGVSADHFTYPFVLKACGGLLDFREGEKVHGSLFKMGLAEDLYVCNSLLIGMYGKFGHIDSAVKLFEEMPLPDLVSWNSMVDAKCRLLSYAEKIFDSISSKNIVAWNAMIGAYALNGQPIQAFDSLENILKDDKLAVDNVTLINLLPSCAQLGAVLQGKTIHGLAIRKGFLPHPVLETALLDMYGEFGILKLAEVTFDQMIHHENSPSSFASKH